MHASLVFKEYIQASSPLHGLQTPKGSSNNKRKDQNFMDRTVERTDIRKAKKKKNSGKMRTGQNYNKLILPRSRQKLR